MTVRLETYLQPGEAVVWRSKGGMRPGQALVLAVAIIVAATGIDWVLSAFMGIAPDIPKVGLILPVIMLLQLFTVPVTLLLSDRRIVIDRGFLRHCVDAVDIADIAEIRLSNHAANLVTRHAGTIRRLDPRTAGTEGRTALDIPAYRAGGEATGWTGEMESALRRLGVRIIEWRYPVLPFGVGMMTMIETVVLIGVAVLIAAPAVAAALWGTAGTGAALLMAPLAVFGSLVVAVFLWPGVALHRYITLLLARPFIAAQTARLYVCATTSPSWRGEEEQTLSARRHAMGTRLARFAAALYGFPVDCSATPGPEAFGGGWRE